MSYRRNKKRKKQRKIVTIATISLLFIITSGYAAFQTNLNITAKGNIKDIKKEVDSKVPTDKLLFWGQADSEENTLTILKDKSSNNNDGVLNGFNNINTSGFYNDELIFDGVDDYVNIGYANYDFKNSISYVIHLSINELKYQSMFGNWNASGSGIECGKLDDGVYFQLHDGNEWKYTKTDYIFNLGQFYTLVATYDGENMKFYIDNEMVSSVTSSSLSISSNPICIGAISDKRNFSNISLKEAMLYDRALTEEEVKSITNGFERKYIK